MKSELMGTTTRNSKKDNNELQDVSKESQDSEHKSNTSQRSFGLTDLWNIQKRQRTGYSMRRRIE